MPKAKPASSKAAASKAPASESRPSKAAASSKHASPKPHSSKPAASNPAPPRPGAKTSRVNQATCSNEGLTVKAYRGDGSVLLAFDLDEHHTADLAGFAVRRTAPGARPLYLTNRLSFDACVHSGTQPDEIPYTPSNQAPFQKFRWVDIPAEVVDGDYVYEVTAMFFADGGRLRAGQTASVKIQIVPHDFGNFRFGFTRGDLSSQAYAQLFKNADIRPKQKTLDYDTKPFEKQYEWLGFHARQLVFDFLDECLKDPGITVDLFAYDIDEPDFVLGLQQLGPRLRAFLDDAPLHTKTGALEIEVHKRLVASAGAANVKQGHFKRFAHNKVMIQKRDGRPVKVLTGSANFSVRGLYVQANNILVFDDPQTASLYAQAFEQTFSDPSKSQAEFAASEIAEGWHDVEADGVPKFSVAFSPHKDATVSLSKVGEAINKAQSSVLFAVMELAGGGPVMDELKALPDDQKVFSYGMTQTLSGVKVYKPGESAGIIVPFDYLKGKVPPPFTDEFSGGMGIVIHDKFVVCDFNGAEPVVFTGSSNLAAGGEESNGDNLLAISDPSVAVAYAVEAVRLVDHFHFRASLKQADPSAPMCLQGPDGKPRWWEPYYDPKNILCRERKVFAG